MEKCSPIIFVQWRIDGEPVHKIWVGQVDAAIADEVCMVLLQCFNPRRPGVAASCNECPLVCVPEHLRKQPLSAFVSAIPQEAMANCLVSLEEPKRAPC